MTEVLHVITGLGEGGAEGALTRLLLADVTHRHAVISLSDMGKHGSRLAAHGIPVTALGWPRGRFSLAGLRSLRRAIRASDAKVVQTWMYHADLLGGLAARAAGKHAIAWGIRNAYLDPRTISRSTRMVAKSCALVSGMVPTRIVSCSRLAAESHAAIGYRRDRMLVIANGYDVDRVKPDAAGRAALRAEWGIADGTFLLGMVARWDPQKDHANLVGALGHLAAATSRDWVCVLVGSGMDRANVELSALIERAGVRDRVRLLGPRDDVPRVMSALDAHVLSSAGEAFPNVVAEAMAAGTPCVVTDVGDAAYIVGSTGWVVPSRDPAALAAAIGLAIDEPSDAAERRGAEARARIVSEFGLARMVAAYADLWTSLAAAVR